MKNIIFSLLICLGFISSVNAQGNAEAGKAKSAMCAACHGSTGLSASPMYPNIAGQHADYIVKQLKAFKNNTTRADSVMSPMAAGLSEEDMADLAAYFASQSRTGEEEAAGDTAALANAPAKYEPDAIAGKTLYTLGDESRGIAACIGCHGKEGHSDVLIYPNLAKQHPEYIAKQLHNFKSKERPNYSMNQFAGAMTNDEIADMAEYFKDPQAVAHAKPKKIIESLADSKDVLAGKEKSAVCSSCHGVDGNSPVAIYPKLAGQNAAYIVKQLTEFKTGVRDNAIMAPMVAGLSDQDMKELAAYYSDQKTSSGAGSANELGAKIYFGGDARRNITACVACHGANGKGMANAGFPVVGKQNVAYLTSQLQSFRSKARNNDQGSMMQKTARKLTDQEIDALADFMSSLK